MFRSLTRTAVRSFHTSTARFAEKVGGPSGPVLNVRFATPNEVIINKAVHMITVPAVTGVMGILADHAPTIAQLKPGIVTVHTNDLADITHRYFVAGGFAVIKNDSSASITAVEAVKVEDLDSAAAKRALDEASSNLAKATTDADKALYAIGVEVNEAIIQAVESK